MDLVSLTLVCIAGLAALVSGLACIVAMLASYPAHVALESASQRASRDTAILVIGQAVARISKRASAPREVIAIVPNKARPKLTLLLGSGQKSALARARPALALVSGQAIVTIRPIVKVGAASGQARDSRGRFVASGQGSQKKRGAREKRALTRDSRGRFASAGQVARQPVASDSRELGCSVAS